MTENVTVTKVINKVEIGADGPQGPTGPTGATGATGAQGPSGVISVTAPITNTGTSTSAIIGINAGVANGVATLDSGGKVPQSQIPAVAITNTFVVASQAAMLALTAEEGDVAVRTDQNKTYILAATPASTLANWQELLTPTDAVQSVDGRTGTVTLSDLYAAKTHASTHASGGTDAVTLAQSQVTNLTTDLAAKAPIASPTFTGTLTTPNVIVTSSTVPANGIYLPAANSLGLATNGALKLSISSAGEIGIGVGPTVGRTLTLQTNITGNTNTRGISIIPTIQSDVTAEYFGVQTAPATAAATFTLSNLMHYRALQSTFGLNSTVTNQWGFYVASSLIGASNNYGFYGEIPSGANRWNVFMNGTAANYFAGQTTVGSTSLTLGSGSVAQQFGVVAGAATTVGAVIRGTASQTADLQQWQNSAGTVIAKIESNGNFTTGSLTLGSSGLIIDASSTAPYFAFGSNTITLNTRNAAYKGLVIKGTASQSANLQEWQNSGATVLTAINASGTINFASGNTATTATAGALTKPLMYTGYITMQIAGTTVKVPYYSN